MVVSSITHKNNKRCIICNSSDKYNYCKLCGFTFCKTHIFQHPSTLELNCKPCWYKIIEKYEKENHIEKALKVCDLINDPDKKTILENMKHKYDTMGIKKLEDRTIVFERRIIKNKDLLDLATVLKGRVFIDKIIGKFNKKQLVEKLGWNLSYVLTKILENDCITPGIYDYNISNNKISLKELKEVEINFRIFQRSEINLKQSKEPIIIFEQNVIIDKIFKKLSKSLIVSLYGWDRGLIIKNIIMKDIGKKGIFLYDISKNNCYSINALNKI